MGYFKHEAVIVTGFDEGRVKVVHEKAVDVFQQASLSLCVSDMTLSRANGFASFAIFPDGSKEGWDTSDAGETCRQEFIEWLKHNSHQYPVYWVLLVVGDEQGPPRITDSDYKYIND